MTSPSIPTSHSLGVNQMASSRTPPAASSDSSLQRSSNHQIYQRTPPFKNKNGVCDVFEEKPPAGDPFEDMDSKEYIERFQKIEADETTRLMAKYFSDKDVYGGNIFEESSRVNGETIKASRFHPAQSYADPIQYLKDKKLSSCPADINKTSSSTQQPP